MEKEGQNGKRKGWGIEKKVSFLFLDKTVSRNLKARRANKALLLKKISYKMFNLHTTFFFSVFYFFRVFCCKLL
jgi:hypothetical protein